MKKKLKQFVTGLALAVLLPGIMHAQGFIVKGRITDASDNSPLIGANIVEVDENGRYTSGTIADVNGNYVLKVSSPDAILQVSFIGYIKETINVSNQSRLDAALQPEAIRMDEITVVGTKMGNDGVIPIRDRVTSVARIEFDELESSMTTTVEEMLQGRLGNVNITQISGDPGAGLNIRIRGTASLNARNNPLIVVNGIPYETDIDESFDFAQADVDKFGNLIDVAPEDIESIEVLKDAASSAIWGSKASNGVLMIKTKRGVKSPPVFNYTYKLTRATEPDAIPMLDGADYARLMADAHFNVNRNEFFNSEGYAIQVAFDPDWEEYWNFNQDTRWIDEITRTAYTQQHNFSVRGGGAKSRYNLSMGYQDEEGTTIGTALQKINILTGFDYDLSSKLQFKTDLMYTRYDQDAMYDRQIGSSPYWQDNIRSKAYKKMPNMSVYERDTNNVVYDDYFIPRETLQGNSKNYYNPVAYANEATNNTLKDNARALFSLRYRPIDVLDITSTVTLDIFDNRTNQFLPFDAIGFNYDDDITNRGYINYIKKSSINTMNRVVYKPKLNEIHNLVIRGQMDTQEQLQKVYEAETSHSGSRESAFPSENLNIIRQKTESSDFRLIGFYLDMNYGFKDRYLFMFGLKAEGTSRFSPESRWGLFPTVSAGWRLSEEPFMQNVNFINDLKFRASWGQSGNSPTDNYLYFRSYSASSGLAYMDIPGAKPNNIELTNLQWEIIEQTNLGLSFFGFKNRMNVEFDVYNKKTRNLYIKDSKIPETTGYGSINSNEGEMLNQGWEFMIDYKIFERNNWSFSLNFNASQNYNIILSLPENYSLTYGNMLENGNYKISNQAGEPIGGVFGYRYLGVYPTDDDALVIDEYGNVVYDPLENVPLVTTMGGSSYEFEGGDARYDDINHDGIIDEQDLVYLGDLNPDLMGGISPRLQVKGWTFNVFFYYKIGQNIINQIRMETEKMYNHDNQSKATNWRWRKAGDMTDVPRALYNEGYNWLGSSRFIEDGSFIRIKSMSLSYNVTPKLLNNIGFKDMKIYLTGYNLQTWTDYSGQDPDVAQPSKPDELPKDWSRTPPSIRYTLGVNISF